MNSMNLPVRLTMEWDDIPGVTLQSGCVQEAEGRWLVTISGTLAQDAPVGDWQVRLRSAFEPTFTYTPHLTPEDGTVVDMHVFRTPAMMMGDSQGIVCVLPVMDGVPGGKNRYYVDLDFPRRTMTLGVTTTRVGEHVIYHRTGEAVLPAGPFAFRFRLMNLTGPDALRNPFRPVLAWYWDAYGRAHSKRLPAMNDLMPYVAHTYAWAFDRWKHAVWQEFDLNGVRVGAPQMIVVTRQSPGYSGVWSQREQLAIWNQAWFCSLRSAQGAFRYGMETGNEDYVAKARMTKELALQFPQEDGLFDSVIATPNEQVVIDGEKVRRSIGWENRFFGNSNRNPYTRFLADSPRHIVDMAWTALHMLTWYEELEQDERLLAYARRFADRLLTLQDPQGYFPAWIAQDGAILPALRQSAESAVCVTFLVKLSLLTGDMRYRHSALRCMDVLIREVMPESRWEDFETYWSCSIFGSEDHVGKKYERNNCYKQCSLSPWWMAQAALACYKATQHADYLLAGERCLDETLMFQSSFQPDHMAVTVIGGFGVMNGDAELNDARQSMFAELFIQYGKLMNRPEYIERGKAALRASFSMMYCPENPVAKQQWEKRWSFLSEQDYGFMMENYGHDGYTDGENLGIGEFTIYDWGNGAASEAVMRIRAHHQELF